MKASKKNAVRALLLAGTAAILCACASTAKLGEGEYELKSNKVVIDRSVKSDLSAAEITPYIRQQSATFTLGRRKDTTLVVFNPSLVGSSEDRILDHLHYLGYYDASVESKVTLKDKKKRARVTYTIHPGGRIKISSISFDVPKGGDFERDFYADTAFVSVRPGDYLSEQSLEAESERSSAAMREKGYFGFTKNYYYFEADTLSGRDSVKLLVQVREYTRNDVPANARTISKKYIGNVSVSRPSTLPFRAKALEELNLIRPGSLYKESTVSDTYERYRLLQLFSSVGIELRESSPDTVDCSINLTPSRLQGLKLQLEASTNSSGLVGISPQLNWYHKNIFHGGERLSLGFLGNFQFRPSDNVRSTEFGVSAGLTLPRFLGMPNSSFKGAFIPRTEIKTSYNYQDRPEYTRNIVSASYGYTGRFYRHFFYQFFPLQVNVVGMHDIDPEFYKSLENNPFMRYTYQNHFDAGAGGMLYYTSGRDLTELEPAFYARLSADLSGNALSLFKKYMPVDPDSGEALVFGVPFAQYVRGELALGRTFQFGVNRKHSLATRLLAGAGYAYGNSSVVPIEKQFWCGGANSMRGHQARALGPGRSKPNEAFSIPSQTGDIRLEMNAEYRFGLFWKLEGAVFADAGNVWTIGDEYGEEGRFTSDFYKSIALDSGVGIRADLSFMVVRIDMGVKLYEPCISSWRGPSRWFEKDGFAVHFGVGYPF